MWEWSTTYQSPQFVRIPSYTGGFIVLNLSQINEIIVYANEESDVVTLPDLNIIHLSSVATDRLLKALDGVTLEAR